MPAVNRPSGRSYLGYRDADHDTPWAEFFDEAMAPLAPHVVEAVQRGAVAPPTMTPFEDASTLAEPGDAPTENGIAIDRDGSMLVAVRTWMPGVTPAMWDWWFGWHGSDTRRYKLWHPRAHLSARWADGADRAGYLGRTSLIEEYLGSTFVRGAIRFVEPIELGLASPTTERDEVAICARTGSRDQPVDIGWLVHHVRPADTPAGPGSEMRSRFWMGGRHVAARSTNPALRAALPVAAKRLYRPDARMATELLVHCAEEMSHLAARLPALHARFGSARS